MSTFSFWYSPSTYYLQQLQYCSPPPTLKKAANHGLVVTFTFSTNRFYYKLWFGESGSDFYWTGVEQFFLHIWLQSKSDCIFCCRNTFLKHFMIIFNYFMTEAVII